MDDQVKALESLLNYHRSEKLRMVQKNVEYQGAVFKPAQIQHHVDEIEKALKKLREIAYGR